MDTRCYLDLERTLMLWSSFVIEALHQADCLRVPSVLHRRPRFLERVLVRCLHCQLQLQRCVSISIQNSSPCVHLLDCWGDCVDVGAELVSG